MSDSEIELKGFDLLVYLVEHFDMPTNKAIDFVFQADTDKSHFWFNDLPAELQLDIFKNGGRFKELITEFRNNEFGIKWIDRVLF